MSVPRTQALLLLAITALALASIRHVGLFADDFVFLDAATRQPAREVWLGWHGIAPWYRPLSRELLFYLVRAAGAAGVMVAHGLAVATVAASTLALLALGTRVASPRVGMAAAALFVLGAFPKALAAWASGYQDTLSIALVLWAVERVAARRPVAAAACALAACFAKETGFLAFPLAALWIALAYPRGTRWRALAPLAGAAALAVAAHVAVRATWPAHPALVATRSMLREAVQIGVAFVRHAYRVGLPSGAANIAGGLALAGLVAWAVARAPRGRGADAVGIAVALAGLALGAAPVLAGAALGLVSPKSYYFVSCWPWLCLLAAMLVGALPGAAAAGALALLAAASFWGTAFRPPNLDDPAGWDPRPGPWDEVSRLSAVAARYTVDLDYILAAAPATRTLLLTGIPIQSYLQQGADGPAARVMTGRGDVRSFYLSDAPGGLDIASVGIVVFDTQTGHLGLWERDPATADRVVFARLAMGQARQAELFGLYGANGAPPTVRLGYAMALAELLLRGPDAYLRALHADGLVDTVGGGADQWVGALAPTAPPAVHAALAGIAHEPCSPRAHAQLAAELQVVSNEAAARAELRAADALSGRASSGSARNP